jgi:hypothetical protein
LLIFIKIIKSKYGTLGKLFGHFFCVIICVGEKVRFVYGPSPINKGRRAINNVAIDGS